MMPRATVVLAASLLVLAACSPVLAESLRRVEPPASGDLGHVDFPTSGTPAAQERFLRGVLWLHSFEYADAREEFQAAQELDPGFAMAYWGEAMARNYPIWAYQDLADGRAVLERLGASREERLAKAPTERERGYLEAVDVLFFGDGEKEARDHAYARAMARLHERFPDDLEAASFYALALLGSCQGERDFAVYMRAAAVVEEVFARNPRHPGAAHYLIHSYDEPIHGPLGLRPARVYAQIAPSAPHALHMPSHIFLALGMWDDSVASNRASWEAALERGQRNYHALWWLLYSHLQQGRPGAAFEQLETIAGDVAEDPTPHARRHLALMRAAFLVDGTDAELAARAAALEVDLDALGAGAAGAHHFAAGRHALAAGDLEAARGSLEALREKVGDDASSEREAAVMALQLEALLLAAEGEVERALERAAEAAEVEGEMSFDFGPPLPIQPAQELYGELLLAHGRPAEALEQLERALERHSLRPSALLAHARAARAAGDETAERRSRERLAEVWRDAEPSARERLEPAVSHTSP